MARAGSAGTSPGERVHPEVVRAVSEVGIDLFSAKPQRLTHELAEGATLLITMGFERRVPCGAGLRRDDWQLPAPKGQPIERVRAIRDDIRSRVSKLIEREGWQEGSREATSAAR